jgi:hypothetical protein
VLFIRAGSPSVTEAVELLYHRTVPLTSSPWFLRIIVV